MVTSYGLTREVLVPVGAWVLIRPEKYRPKIGIPDLGGLLPYHGESTWKLSLSRFGLEVQRDRGEPQLEALIASTDAETFLDDFGRLELNNSVSVSRRLAYKIDALRRRGIVIHAVDSGSRLLPESAFKDLLQNPLKCYVGEFHVADLSFFDKLKDIEALSVKFENSEFLRKSVFDPSKWDGFGSLRELRHLKISGKISPSLIEIDKPLENLISFLKYGVWEKSSGTSSMVQLRAPSEPGSPLNRFAFPARFEGDRQIQQTEASCFRKLTVPAGLC